MPNSAHKNSISIAVMPGDGIGPEVMKPAIALMDRALERTGGPKLSYEELDAGAECYRRTGTPMSEEVFEKAAAADAILFGAMGLPDVRRPDGIEIAPQLDLRFRLELFAGVRPVRTIPGAPTPLADPRAKNLDFVLIRESTEGLFTSRGKGEVTPDYVRETWEITRAGSERLFDFALQLGRRRKAKGSPGSVACVDKSGVFRAFAFFRQIFFERAKAFPDIDARAFNVDATALDLIRRPWIFDVLVTENQFGDILSDAGAALMGGMGMAPSADIGLTHGLFQPCHGTAPDIVGMGKANPTAMILSAAMMLDWLGETKQLPSCGAAADLLQRAVDAAFAPGDLRPFELGGEAGTQAITDRVATQLEALPLEA
ncbi:3-isopropylmalate dehydrogenase [Alsobacter soli]|uniref:3-isopropylmalate dehydrogenase n=1 Tax=Alsobacter soli TaxID=2109933 RepID=A0A2T1HQA0_9HYPH|nr:isocitrate/isopropylmalate family dehydrogenase [Alsobacter soli]PSC03830.1 3-isopropylmalate dehydrogenase [Alsobacter soli]